MATAILPKTKLTSKPSLSSGAGGGGGGGGGVGHNSSIHTRPSPTPSKTLPGTPTTNGTGGANGNLRMSERRRTAPKPFGGEVGSAGGRGKNKDGKDKDGEGDEDALMGLQPPRKKLKPMPHVITTKYILNKYKDKPPSLVLHMHPTSFRFEQQDGSFSYASPMRSLLENIAQETIPPDAVEVFRNARIPYYEGRLIVKIHDHRTNANTKSQESGKPAVKSDEFSIHKWNDHLTHSPFVPYPSHLLNSRGASAAPAFNGEHSENKENTDVQMEAAESKKVYLTVLHPTSASFHAEVSILASTPVPLPSLRAQRQQPPTPISSTPLSATHPPNLTVSTHARPSQTILNDKSALAFEADYLLATAPALILEPATDGDHARSIIKALAHPHHSRPLPPRKARKRTVAELAADEAFAAEEERLMLIMDERRQASSTTAGDDGAVGSNGFEPSFEKWNLIQQIQTKHQEENRQKELKQRTEAEAERNKALLGAQESQTRMAQAQAAQQQAARLQAQKQQQQMQMQAQEQARAQQAAAGHHTNGIVNQGSPIQTASSPFINGHQSSPIASHNMPHIASQPASRQQSPHMGNIQHVQNQGQMASSPMVRNQSNHAHPNQAVAGSQGSPLARNVQMANPQQQAQHHANLVANGVAHSAAQLQQNNQALAHHMLMNNSTVGQAPVNVAQKAAMQIAQQRHLQQQEFHMRQRQQILQQRHMQQQHAAAQQNGGVGAVFSEGFNMNNSMTARAFGGTPVGGQQQFPMNMQQFNMMNQHGMGVNNGVNVNMMNAMGGMNMNQMQAMAQMQRGRGIPPQGQGQ